MDAKKEMDSALNQKLDALRQDTSQQERQVAERLKILDEFSQNLKDNLARIEINEDRMLKIEAKLDEFQNDDVF